MLSKISSAHLIFRVNCVLTIGMVAFNMEVFYISLFREILLQLLNELLFEIHGTLTKLCALKVSRGHPLKVAKWRLVVLNIRLFGK